MKHSTPIVLLVLSFLFIIGCSTQTYTDTQMYAYKGFGLNCNVKSVKVLTYDAKYKFGEITKMELSEASSENLYCVDNYIAEFGDNGICKTITRFEIDGEIEEKEIIKVKDDLVTEITVFDSDGDISNTLSFTWDEGNISTVSIADHRGVIYQRIEDNYNDGLVSEQRYYWDDTLKKVTKYTWDGTVCNFVEYDGNGDESNRGYSSYSKEKRWLGTKSQNQNVEVTYNSKGLPETCHNAIYDSSSDSFRFNDSDKDLFVTYEYEYDSKGNWIKRIMFLGEGKRPYQISEREITY